MTIDDDDGSLFAIAFQKNCPEDNHERIYLLSGQLVRPNKQLRKQSQTQQQREHILTMMQKTVFLVLWATMVTGFMSPLMPRRHPVLLGSTDYDSLDDMPSDESFIEAVNEAESLDDAPSDVEEEVKGSSSMPAGVPAPPMPIEDALTTLLQIAASTGRGEFATPTQKEKAESLIAIIEAQNPTAEPANSPLVNGRWELLYSSTQLFRSSPFFMAGRAVCSTPEQAKQYDWFCDMHRKALAISSIGQVRQIISPTRMVSEFEVTVGAVPFLRDFTPFAYSGGWPVTIEGAIVSSADISPNAFGDAWELYMDTVEIKGSNIPGLRQVLDQGLMLGSRQLGDFLENNLDGYTNPRPVFEITYLSKNLRISREQDGKVFVYGKLSDELEPSDYSKVEADLGALTLLEGFNDAITKFYI